VNAGESPRILLVGDVNPTGKSTGTQRRITATARGLARVGTVDYLQWGSLPWRRGIDRVTEVEEHPGLARHVLVRRRRTPDRLRSLHRAAWKWWPPGARTGARSPFVVANAPLPPAQLVRTALGDIHRYDLVWCFELTSAVVAFDAFPSIPTVVDIDAVPYLDRDPSGDDRFHARDRAAWQHGLERVAQQARRVTFSNPAEADRLALPNGVVLPNGCRVPPFHGARPVQHPAVLGFVGWMGYEANADAACHLVSEIVPVLRECIGTGYVVRLVGSATPEIEQLGSDPNVEVTGYVDDLDAELARMDVALVPVRRGAGTRIKVLEALAAQLPVVSTTFGAQGLEVRDGEHLLLADTPADFATACRRLLEDDALRERVVRAGYDLVAAHHDWSVIQADVAEIASEAIACSP
jgi:glycosyltransferase involved in cell wall biosynthesis